MNSIKRPPLLSDDFQIVDYHRKNCIRNKTGGKFSTDHLQSSLIVTQKCYFWPGRLYWSYKENTPITTAPQQYLLICTSQLIMGGGIDSSADYFILALLIRNMELLWNKISPNYYNIISCLTEVLQHLDEYHPNIISPTINNLPQSFHI